MKLRCFDYKISLIQSLSSNSKIPCSRHYLAMESVTPHAFCKFCDNDTRRWRAGSPRERTRVPGIGSTPAAVSSSIFFPCFENLREYLRRKVSPQSSVVPFMAVIEIVTIAVILTPVLNCPGIFFMVPPRKNCCASPTYAYVR
jgi:hypothetical protein